MKVLVTGASGFVGSHVIELLEKLNYEVYALVRDPKKLEGINFSGKVIQGDLNASSYHDFMSLLPTDLDAIVHTAGIVHSFDEEEFYAVNTEPSVRLLKAVRNFKPRNGKHVKFIFVSSLAAMGPSKLGKPLTEKSWPKPVSHYGKSKLRAEQEMHSLIDQYHHADLVILRPPMIIGPRDTGVLEILKMVKKGVLLNTGKSTKKKEYSFISVFDFARLVERALRSKAQGYKVYLTAHPRIITLEELVNESKILLERSKVIHLQIPFFFLQTTAHLLGAINKISTVKVRLTPDKLKEIAPNSWTCHSEKLEKDFQYRFEDSLRSILEQTIRDYQTRGWL